MHQLVSTLNASELPDDVLYEIFSYCDATTLRILCRVCHRFRHLASEDIFWIEKGRKCLATNQASDVIRNRSCCLMSAKEKCRVTLNWTQEKYRQVSLLKRRTRYMPWLQLSTKELWLSQGANIMAYEHRPSGHIGSCPLRVLSTKDDQDICKFVTTDECVFGSGSDGGIFSWSVQTGEPNFANYSAHSGSIDGLDIYGQVLLSASKDRTVKIWKISGRKLSLQQNVILSDRVWSVAADPSGETFVCGTGGCYDRPLLLLRIETGRQIMYLGENYKFGAGVLHCMYENYHSLLTAGYDTYIRLWDTRTSNSNRISSVIRWENPYDMAVYCLSSDQNVTFISGSAAHGLVWLWDKRSTRPIQMYYVGDSKSPVYSIAFDPCHMYVALDSSLCMLNFT